MEKVYIILFEESDRERISNIIESHKDNIKDKQMTKIFKVRDQFVAYWIIVTDDETFEKITKEMNGTVLY